VPFFSFVRHPRIDAATIFSFDTPTFYSLTAVFYCFREAGFQPPAYILPCTRFVSFSPTFLTERRISPFLERRSFTFFWPVFSSPPPLLGHNDHRPSPRRTHLKRMPLAFRNPPPRQFETSFFRATLRSSSLANRHCPLSWFFVAAFRKAKTPPGAMIFCNFPFFSPT